MKKIISTILVCVLLVGSVFTLASCGKSLTGEYKEALTGNIIYEFGMFGKVTKTVDNIIGDDDVFEGKYKFNDDGTKITMTFDDEAETYSFSSGTDEDGKDYIKLDGWKYNKVEK